MVRSLEGFDSDKIAVDVQQAAEKIKANGGPRGRLEVGMVRLSSYLVPKARDWDKELQDLLQQSSQSSHVG